MSPTSAAEIVNNQRGFFQSNATQSYDFRLQQLKKLKRVIQEHEQEFIDALKQDLARPEFEAYFELVILAHEISDAIKKLKSWMKPQKIKTGLMAQPGTSYIKSTPLGNTLNIIPYNYPIVLALQPLVGALAAGNTMVLKPSEITPACSKALYNAINNNFDANYIAVMEGEVEVTTALLECKFDHIFFTGSARVGRIILTAAAKHLTPVTLELGGKSPVIVDKNCDIALAVRRIAAGKFLNAGQTCIAPDHVYVHTDIQVEFTEKMKACILAAYGNEPVKSKDIGRIINDTHFNRIRKLIDPDKVVVGGQTQVEDKFIAPTLLQNVTMDDAVMQQEIFGPLLPIIEFSCTDDIYQNIAKLPQHPLAMYIFTNNKIFENELITNIRCGGVNVNNTLMQVANAHLPFGGIGESGAGSYHGKHSFDLFSHKKGVVRSATWIDPKLRYAPYGTKVNLLKKLFNWL